MCKLMIIVFLHLSLLLSLSLSTEVCQQYYKGHGFCDSIEGYGNRTVYVDRSTSKWGPLGLESVEQFLENLLPQLTGDVGNDTWTPGCEHSIRQLLCHITVPFCKDQGERGR